MQARRVVQRGRVRGGARRRTGGVEVPGRDARDDPAHDRTDARELLMTPSAAKLVATRRTAGRIVPDASGQLHATQARSHIPATAAPAGAARRIAVDVVARTRVTERRVVGLPPPGGHRAWRATVLAVADRAAERSPTDEQDGSRAAQRRTRRPGRRRYCNGFTTRAERRPRRGRGSCGGRDLAWPKAGALLVATVGTTAVAELHDGRTAVADPGWMRFGRGFGHRHGVDIQVGEDRLTWRGSAMQSTSATT